MLKLVHDATVDAVDDPEVHEIGLDELCRTAAQEMLAVALLAERRAYLDAHATELDETGKRLVVGNGFARPREVTTGAGMVEVTAPRVDDRRDGERFTSAILPAYMRKSPKVTEVLPILYLRGLSTGDFAPALAEFFGSAAGLSASTVNRLTEAWQTEHEDWSTRNLSAVDYVYLWADGVHFNIRLEEDRLCCLVIVGVRPDGTKELVALADGYRESTDSWADVLRSLRDRGLVAPVLAVGDGALGFWGALREVFPTTREQRCWVHKTANVLDALPKTPPRRREGGPREDLRGALTHRRARGDEALRRCLREFPKATTKITGDLDVLLALFDFPEEHWIHLRTTNPIESTFSTVRLRTRVTRGAGSRKAGLAMAYKLLDAAQVRWRRINGHELVPLVRAGATFIDGKLRERSDQKAEETAESEENTGSVR